ncbi:hypothetical protein ACFXKY_12545 [Streptomyces canus]|uniref:hypothetical protein n=1 Tax=Streptomyces canus TaxID=58343 RepID=UPI0036B0AD88
MGNGAVGVVVLAAGAPLLGDRDADGAAYNRLSPILSALIHTAQLAHKQVSARIGCSASSPSRILSGRRVPTWAMTRT